MTLVFFAIANLCFQASQIFYDALLPVVSTEENRGRVSGYGVGVGYLGSFIMLGAGTLILAAGGSPIDIFRTTGLLFLLFALPCFLFVREQPRRVAAGFSGETVVAAFRAIRQTAQRVGDYDGLRRFLLSRALYNDVANTLATFMVVYAEQELAFTKEDVTIVGACTIVASIAGGLFWGSIIDRIGPKRTLTIVLVLWMVTLLLGVVIPMLALPKAWFFLVGSMIGVTLAGTWASDRTLLLRLAPPRFLGQFYGLYAMVGRFGQIIGPLLWGFIAVTLGLGRPLALASLIIIVAVAFVILRPVSDERREWRSDELVQK